MYSETMDSGEPSLLAPRVRSTDPSEVTIECHRKYRRANARPEPDFKYISKICARSASENSIVVTSFHGLPLAVCFESPALCAASRA